MGELHDVFMNNMEANMAGMSKREGEGVKLNKYWES
jgi:hypothetical protein